MSIRSEQFDIIDIEYFKNFGIEGLETLISRKEARIVELENKNQEFKAQMGEKGAIIVVDGKSVPAHSILKTSAFKRIFGIFKKEGYNAFDEIVFKEVNVYGNIKETVTVYKAIDGILSKAGFDTPKSQNQEVMKYYRSIFWYIRRRFQIPELQKELEELKWYKELREEEDNSLWDKTTLEDYAFEDSEEEIDW